MSLHYNPMSSSSRRVTITAALLGIRFDEHVVDLRDRGSRGERDKGEGFAFWKATEPPPSAPSA